MKAPIVFISYSYDSDEHKTWVREFAAALRALAIDVILDQWEIGPGNDLPKFMEQGVRRATRVVMVCTEQYVRKADDGKGGAGYEAMIVTGELVEDLGTRKFIPIIRQTSGLAVRPACVATRMYVDFSSDERFDTSVEQLARDIHDAREFEKPPLGSNPFADRATGGQVPLAKAPAGDRLDISADPYATYELSREYANEGNFARWRELIHQLKLTQRRRCSSERLTINRRRLQMSRNCPPSSCLR